MANTYTQLFIHTVFVVKGRESLIPKEHFDQLFRFISGLITKMEHKLFIINGMPEYFYLLIGLNPNQSLSTLIKEVKRCSSIYINEKKIVRAKFEWDKVYKYIANQENHHSKKSFKNEYIELLEKFNIEYNPKYIFEEINGDSNQKETM
ncbi:MAG: transposase [Candidatus Kapabacteria bacterium]|nr:transposase [Candidatus Kapabacteria bacterium]